MSFPVSRKKIRRIYTKNELQKNVLRKQRFIIIIQRHVYFQNCLSNVMFNRAYSIFIALNMAFEYKHTWVLGMGEL